MYSGNAPTQRDKGTYCTELFKREAVRFVRENKDRPFFLYLPFQRSSRSEQPRSGDSLRGSRDRKVQGHVPAP